MSCSWVDFFVFFLVTAVTSVEGSLVFLATSSSTEAWTTISSLHLPSLVRVLR